MAAGKSETLLVDTARIVGAYMGRQPVSHRDVAGLITDVHAALTALRHPPASAPVVSAAPIRAHAVKGSLTADSITCLECGLRAKMLKRHLSASHGLTPHAYRMKWGLPLSYPMVCSSYGAVRRELALKIGLGTKKGSKSRARA